MGYQGETNYQRDINTHWCGSSSEYAFGQLGRSWPKHC